MKIYPMFFSKSFIVSALLFRLSLHFELTFIYNVRQGSNLILWHVGIPLSWHNLLKRLFFFFLHWMVLALLSKINWPWMYGFISVFSMLTPLYFYGTFMVKISDTISSILFTSLDYKTFRRFPDHACNHTFIFPPSFTKDFLASFLLYYTTPEA